MPASPARAPSTRTRTSPCAQYDHADHAVSAAATSHTAQRNDGVNLGSGIWNLGSGGIGESGDLGSCLTLSHGSRRDTRHPIPDPPIPRSSRIPDPRFQIHHESALPAARPHLGAHSAAGSDPAPCRFSDGDGRRPALLRRRARHLGRDRPGLARSHLVRRHDGRHHAQFGAPLRIRSRIRTVHRSRQRRRRACEERACCAKERTRPRFH